MMEFHSCSIPLPQRVILSRSAPDYLTPTPIQTPVLLPYIFIFIVIHNSHDFFYYIGLLYQLSELNRTVFHPYFSLDRVTSG